LAGDQLVRRATTLASQRGPSHAVLMPSTPFGISAGRAALFRVVSRRQI
jgi:hypothetical protein